MLCPFGVAAPGAFFNSSGVAFRHPTISIIPVTSFPRPDPGYHPRHPGSTTWGKWTTGPSRLPCSLYLHLPASMPRRLPWPIQVLSQHFSAYFPCLSSLLRPQAVFTFVVGVTSKPMFPPARIITSSTILCNTSCGTSACRTHSPLIFRLLIIVGFFVILTSWFRVCNLQITGYYLLLRFSHSFLSASCYCFLFLLLLYCPYRLPPEPSMKERRLCIE